MKESEEHLRLAMEAGNMGTWDWDLLTGKITWSSAIERIHGIKPGTFDGTYEAFKSDIHPEDCDTVLASIAKSVNECVDHHLEYRIVRPDGTIRWIEGRGRVVADGEGRTVRMLGVCSDITARKAIEARLLEQSELLETLNEIGMMLAGELNLQRLVQAVTDAATELIGARFGSFFYNLIDERGESYMLYTLSGVPLKHFSRFPMPRATDLFGPTFRGEAIIRIPDVKKDPRYGKNSPYYGMPEGHLPVTSYLAVPVVSRSGEVLGGLFFGHPDESVFTERDERIVAGLAAQAAVAMDNAKLYEEAQAALREKEEAIRMRDQMLDREQQTRKDAEAANRSKDEFLATISHELRTPLNAMLGWARMLQTGRLDEETVAQALGTIERNAKAQAQLIEDMLDVSRIITGKLKLEVQPVEFASVIKAAVETAGQAADSKQIRLQMALDSNAGLVTGDPDRLQQVMWNLLSNAIKFTPRGGEVRVRLALEDSQLEVSVSDTGQGIAPDFLPFVFDRFRQEDSTLTRSHGGLGLGLAIVRHIVEMHGGTVSAESPGEGLGATFTIRLPARIARTGEVDSIPTIHDLPTGNLTDLLEDAPRALEGLKVLVVDDEPDARLLLKAILDQFRAEVRVCASASEALLQAESWRPDVLVSDIEMPGEDGYTLIRKLRAGEARDGHRLPALALTAHARAEDRMRALAAGYNIHAAKPIDPAELIIVISSLSGRSVS